MSHPYAHIISSEYDAATLRTPKDCVHWASGDMRIGKQLLDAAADDARISVAFLSLSGAASAGLIGRPLEALRGHLAA